MLAVVKLDTHGADKGIGLPPSATPGVLGVTAQDSDPHFCDRSEVVCLRGLAVPRLSSS